jgi:hypothetical protein
VHPGWTATVDEHANLRLTVSDSAKGSRFERYFGIELQ